MPTGSFGPRRQAVTGFLTGRMGASQRETQEILETLFQTEVSVGGIAAWEQAVSNALAAPVGEVPRYAQQQHLRKVDETGWREKAKRLWLWVCTTPLVNVFYLDVIRLGCVGYYEILPLFKNSQSIRAS